MGSEQRRSGVVAQIAEIAGVDRAAVLRVITGGGTSAADWGIAQAVETVTGRRAADVMWGHTSDFDAPAPAPTNPRAVHDPSTTIYAEDSHGLVTETGEQAEHAPQSEEVEEEEDGAQAAEDLAASVYSDLVAYAAGSRRAADRISAAVAAAASRTAARAALYRALAAEPRTSVFGLHPEPAALAA
ncbi:hypothetical protein [Nocardiopsis composta]|uniref:Uncharacterized protein n=1 Tax=Nocardiopsis composta TaxID=157465 RepID=A0A7W8QTI0_9ACTN|nr:hypothetical protein [Nocardiopsis composta]MBB5436297.1 hypothetical protein [Nocardiopsis composta]